MYIISRRSSNRRTDSTQRTSTISTIPKDLNHFYKTTSSLQRLCSPRSPMVSLLDLLFPRDLFGAKTQLTAPGSAQSVQGKNNQEASYQEGSKDHISHRESSGFHFIEIHQGTVGEMLSLIILFGLSFCCLRFLIFQFLRQQQLRNLRERFLRGHQNPDGNLHEMNQIAGQGVSPQRHQDPESGQIAFQPLHGGRYPSAIISQSDLHHNLRWNI